MIQGQGEDGGGAPQADAAADPGLPDDPVAAAHDAIRAEPGYQFTPTDPPPPPPAREPLFGGPFWEAVGSLLTWLIEAVFWIGLVALAALVVWFAGRAGLEAYRRRGGRAGPEAPAPYVPAAATVRTLLEDAAKLAAQGRYGEAVRLILRRSIEDMERQRPGAVRDAMTSREIAVLPVLTEAARAAFGRIAALVERAAFAGRELTEREYEEARGIYERLTSKLMREAA